LVEKTLAKGITEIRWHGRGGQGVKTAALLLAEVALADGQYSQGFPDYGPERMGAPIRGYTRVSDAPIRMHCAIENPDAVVVLDATLLGVVDVAAGLKEGRAILINSKDKPEAVAKKFKLEKFKVMTVDATGISLDEIGRAIPNTPMVGALLKALPVVPVETLIENMRQEFAKKFSQKIIDGNVKAVERAYQEVSSDE